MAKERSHKIFKRVWEKGKGSKLRNTNIPTIKTQQSWIRYGTY